MLDLKAQARKVVTALGKGQDHDRPKAPGRSARPIRAKAGPRLGRELAFSFDERSIEMACVTHFGFRKKILDVRKQYIPRELKEGGEQQAYIGDVIERYVKEFGRPWARISVTISGKETAYRTFIMPHLRPRELVSAIRFESEKQLPFPLEDCLYDFHPISRLFEGTLQRDRVALHAVTHRRIHGVLEPFRQRHITVSAVRHSQDLIGKLLKHLPSFSGDDHLTLINVAFGHSEISFYRGIDLEFFHISSMGSSILNDRTRTAGYGEVARALAQEILASLDYYAGQYPGAATDTIYVYGDLSYSDELLGLLNGHTGVEFVRFPTESLDFVSGHRYGFARDLPTCLPVLACAVCDTAAANLLPYADRLRQAQHRTHVLGRTALIAILFSLAAGWTMAKRDVAVTRSTLEGLTRQIAAFSESEAFHTYTLAKRQMARSRAYIEEAAKLPSYLSLNLKELTLVTPPSIRLVNLTYEPESEEGNLMLQGLVTSADVPPEVLLAEYVEALDGSPFFESVTIHKHVKKRHGGAFEIEFLVKMRGVV